MHRRNGLDRLDLDDYFVFHNQVRPESRLDPGAWINYGNNLLPDRAQAWLFQLVCQDRCVGRFQQARSEAGMNAVGRVHDLLRHLVFVHVHLKNNLPQSRQDRKENSRGCQTMPAGPLGRSALRESIGVLPFAVSCSLRAETRSAKGERHATFYEQISGPDSWNTEWLRPLGGSGVAGAE